MKKPETREDLGKIIHVTYRKWAQKTGRKLPPMRWRDVAPEMQESLMVAGEAAARACGWEPAPVEGKAVQGA